MKHPIEVTVDPDFPSAYVTYDDRSTFDGSVRFARDAAGRLVEYDCFDSDHEPTGVVIDLSEDERIMGIEIIDVRQEEAVQIARDYAAAHDLAFPARLEPVVRPSA